MCSSQTGRILGGAVHRPQRRRRLTGAIVRFRLSLDNSIDLGDDRHKPMHSELPRYLCPRVGAKAKVVCTTSVVILRRFNYVKLIPVVHWYAISIFEPDHPRSNWVAHPLIPHQEPIWYFFM
jgi:hypothetical protein